MRNHSPRCLVAVLFLLTISAHAATYFVRSSASGNGTSWANAWGNVSSINWNSLAAGDIVCIAGGTYSGGLSFGKSGASGNPITIKRAYGPDATCGSTTTGWNAAYDAQVNISSIDMAGSYVTVDGIVWNGIRVVMGNLGSTYYGIGQNGPLNGITLRYIEVAGPCNGTMDSSCMPPNNGDSRGLGTVSWNGSNYDSANNMLAQYLNVHGTCDGLYLTAWSGIIEHSRIADTMSVPNGGYTCHDNVLIGGQTGLNITFRYNEITNWLTEGILLCPGPGGCPASTFYMYGNVWHDASSQASNGRVFAIQNSSTVTVIANNNTFSSKVGSQCYSAEGGVIAGGSSAANNLYFGNSYAHCGWPFAEDYSYSDHSLSETHGQGNASDIFVNYSAKTIAGYHLKSHTTPGLNLGSSYNLDYDGNPRVTWDRGAFEDGPAVATAPNPPSHLAAAVQ